MTAPAKSPARSRVLDAATRLFYADGVHTVGVDRIIAEAGVAKATFYHHFRTKDDLVAAYLTDQCRRQQQAAEALAGGPPRATVLAVYDHIAEAGAGPGFRGCPFINAAAEYPDPDHPVRRAVGDYRRWFRGLMRDLLAADGHPDPARTADILLVLRDGLVVGSDLDDPGELRKLTREAVERALTPRDAAA
ncbi:TetR/AcrR family transcriptional regulator [Streptomyces phytophilus]|uniref:TetR/AcrR family transcriptional regulator n=1 Tax=Streptomyces phytophilus TaxID=722715 RepID=UPI0015F0F75C|nr:TetR/AcrR family transcriptional regulator [Streptomyces phytophilus]